MLLVTLACIESADSCCCFSCVLVCVLVKQEAGKEVGSELLVGGEREEREGRWGSGRREGWWGSGREGISPHN